MRRWLRPVWVVLALLFLLEAWLWDHLQPIVARAVNFIPWGRVKVWLKRLIEDLPPWAALGVFIIPFIVLLPLKFLEVFFLAEGQWLAAGLVLIAAKLLGLGVTAFVFDATRDKLLQIAWFARMFDWFMWARDWSHEITEPVRARARRLMWLLKPQRAGKFLRRLMKLRRRAYRSHPA
ncbi:MAG TPA: hypothetical protein VFW22_16505 [Pseudolabrys sp.]|nr:hypothetical protein [Pseudolabrys sp.]